MATYTTISPEETRERAEAHADTLKRTVWITRAETTTGDLVLAFERRDRLGLSDFLWTLALSIIGVGIGGVAYLAFRSYTIINYPQWATLTFREADGGTELLMTGDGDLFEEMYAWARRELEQHEP